MEWFYTNSTNLTGTRILLVLFSALCIAMLIFLTYKLTYRGVAYNVRFNVTNVIILLICVVLMLMISSNIVISLGMVGALSVVRFRTALKNPHDTAYVFWAIVEGLCVGSQNFKLAIISTLFISAIIFVFRLISNANKKYLIVVRGDGTVSQDRLFQALTVYAKHIDLRTVTITNAYEEFIFEIRVQKPLTKSLPENLSKISGVASVNWLVESGDTVG